MADVFEFEKARCPENAGVDSKEIVEFFNDMKENGLEFHSFMVVRNGKIACEFYRAPFNAETPHSVYSVSKSFTSTAVGIAIGEGYFSLDTRLVDIFPEYDTGDERLGKITVRHLVTMTAGKQPDMFADKGKIDWIKDYFNAPWYGEPGVFRYVNENIYMLSAIIMRTTGMSVRQFLTPRLFEPLGIDVPFWETDKNGIEAGGWGLYIKLRDLAKLMYCYSHGGKAGDKQLIPEAWVKDASVAHSDSSICIPLDNSDGYGYCFWRCGGCRDSFRADGMFSQFGIVFEKEDAMVISMGGIADEQTARDCIWRHFPKAFIEPDKRAKKSPVPEFSALAEKFPVDVPVRSFHNLREAKLNNSTIKVRKKIFLNLIGFPVSVLPLAVTFMTTDKAGNIDNINLDFKDDRCVMSWTEGDESNTVECGMEGRLIYGNMTLGGIDYTVCCSAQWTGDDDLRIDIRPVTTIAKRRLDFSFKGDSFVKIKPTSTPAVEDIARTLLVSLNELLPEGELTEKFMSLARKAVALVPPIVEPTHKGRLVKRK